MTVHSPDIISIHPATAASSSTNEGRWRFVGLLLVIAVAPLWFGSNRSFAWNLNAALVGALVIWGAVESIVLNREGSSVALNEIRFPAIGFGLVALWIVVQTMPGIPELLANSYWPLAAEALDAPLSGRISIAPGMTAVALVRYLTDGAVFWLAYQLCNDRDRGRILISTVALSACIYSLYGLMSFAADINYVLWVEKSSYKSDLTATFINRNSFATYAGVGAMAALEMLFRNWRELRKPGAVWCLTGWSVVLFIVLAALLLTHSRAGMVTALIGLMTLAILRIVAYFRFGLMGWLMIGGAVLVGASAMIMAYAYFNTHLLSAADDAVDRFSVYRLAWEGLLREPLTGYGYGTFEMIFPTLRDGSLQPYATWDRAHNVYLEVALGLGLPATGLLLAVLGRLFGVSLWSALTARRDTGSERVAVAVAVAIALHSLLDFSLQMQGLSIVFFALLGAAAARAFR